MHTKWLYYNGNYYYCFPGDDGRMATGWQNITVNGTQYTYYFRTGDDGTMAKSWLEIPANSGNFYYFIETSGAADEGARKTGWHKYYSDGAWRWSYLDPAVNGRMHMGWKTIGSYSYYFRETVPDRGRMLTGWQEIGGKGYYFKPSGADEGRLITFDVAVQNCFDNGMKKRWGGSGTATDTQMSNGISYYAEDIARDFYRDLFNINILNNFPALYTSCADICKNGYGSLAMLNKACSCDPVISDSHQDPGVPPPPSPKHKHTNNMQSSFLGSHPAALTPPRVIPILWTGHITYHLKKGELTDIAYSPEDNGSVYMCNAGIVKDPPVDETTTQKTITDFKSANNNIRFIYLHEMAHCFGASDSRCDGAGCTISNCWNHNSAAGYSKNCLMTGSVAIPTLKTTPQLNWFCANCKADIRSYLPSNY